jgi:hypothetical protein
MRLQPLDPLSAHDAGRELPDHRSGHVEEMRTTLILVFLAASMVLLVIGLVIGTVVS